MTHRIADELLQMILAPSLHVFDEKFSSASNTAFGSNVNFPASSILLVCKRWLRIATPLLYEVVVLRSTAQAQALAEAFSLHRAFPLYVKKIRLEGAYSCLWDVFKGCSNLHTLCFTLDIYAVVAVTGLCRALRAINPTRVILLDQCETKNAKNELVFSKLIESIPHWTNLAEFHFPYARTESCFRGSKPERLAIALSESESLRTISAELPLSWDETWSTMATNPNIIFKFRETQPGSDLKRYIPVIKAIYNNPEIAVKTDKTLLATVLLMMQENREKASAQVYPKPSFTPLTHVPSSTAESLWTMIFAFATSPGHPDVLNLRELTSNRNALCSLNFTRKSLTLVSKQFYVGRDLPCPILSFPFVGLAFEAEIFATISFQNTAPRQGKVINPTHVTMHRSPSDVNFELTALIPHLIGLEHFVGGLSPSISSAVFTLLAETAGPTLITIRHLSIAVDEAFPHTVFAHFRRLSLIEFARSPQVMTVDTSTLPRNLLPNFSTGFIYAKKFADLRSTTVKPRNNRRFYEIHRHPREVSTAEAVKGGLSGLLSDSTGHSRLTKICLRVPNLYMTHKDTMFGLKGFFSALLKALANRRFPSLREINIAGYKWPIEERDIEKDVIVKDAIKIKTTFSSVNITDEDGHPWRIRAERRR
ncbi:hypothetical protein JB92DRAFT_3104630 [Gautieria morchelliformis]|nr:hypothetical protein JB92DRAFT_3104630 [Gautieria morchelliformis]